MYLYSLIESGIMILKEFLYHLQKLAQKYPYAKVIYAVDYKGTAFNIVHHSPALCWYDIETKEVSLDSDGSYNAICIN